MGGTDADGKPRLGLCMKPCVEDQSCVSGCCAQSAHFEQAYCASGPAPCIGACKRQNESCLGRHDQCCSGLVCVKSEAEPLLDGCQIPCTKGSECESNCCLLFTLEDGSKAESGVCAVSDYCK